MFTKSTYTVKLREVLGLLLRKVLHSVWVLEHIEFVNDIELNLTEDRQLESLLLPRLLARRLHLLQLHVDLVLDRALPAAHLTVVEGGEDVALGIKRSQLD